MIWRLFVHRLDRIELSTWFALFIVSVRMERGDLMRWVRQSEDNARHSYTHILLQLTKQTRSTPLRNAHFTELRMDFESHLNWPQAIVIPLYTLWDTHWFRLYTTYNCTYKWYNLWQFQHMLFFAFQTIHGNLLSIPLIVACHRLYHYLSLIPLCKV